MNKHIELARDLRKRINPKYAAQRVCKDCGVPVGSLHMVTCKTGGCTQRVTQSESIELPTKASEPAPHRCKFCGSPSWVDPSDQSPPLDYCHESDHGESAPKKECQGCRMAEKYIKQLKEENHKLLSAHSSTTLERETIAVNLMRLTQGLDKHTARLIADQCIELARQPAPKRDWVSISDSEIYPMYNDPRSDAEIIEFARELEAKLKELNHG